jgi:hypothetical protein
MWLLPTAENINVYVWGGLQWYNIHSNFVKISWIQSRKAEGDILRQQDLKSYMSYKGKEVW